MTIDLKFKKIEILFLKDKIYTYRKEEKKCQVWKDNVWKMVYLLRIFQRNYEQRRFV